MPVLLAGVSVEGIDAVVCRSDEDHVVRATRDGQICHVKRLCVDLVIHGHLEQEPELATVHVGRSKGNFACVHTIAVIVVVLRKDACLPAAKRRCQQQKEGNLERSG